jgi:Flp pilus assembly protein TadG
MRSRPTTVLGNEGGQTMIIVAVALVALFGFLALTFDVGRMYLERRQLQRTADLSAYSAAQTDGSNSSAAATADQYAIDNPTSYRSGKISPTSSSPCDYLYINDFNDAHAPAYTPPGSPCPNPTPSNPCIIASVPYYCVHTQVASKNFKLLFAPMVGIGANRTVTASATAIVGAAAPVPQRLVPWMIQDCPYPFRYPDEASVSPLPSGCTQDGTTTTPGTGYQISTTFNQYPTNLFLGNSGGSQSGNFLGADLDTSNCRGTDQGNNGGGNAYKAVLSGTTLACPISKGARLVPQTGSQGSNTVTALTTRGVLTWDGGAPCTTAAAFNKTVTPVGGDQVQIKDRTNPCLVGIVFVVQANLADSRMTSQNWDFHGKTCSYTGQAAVTTNAMDCIGMVQEPNPNTRFSALGGNNHGSSDYLLVRRFGLFYMTQMGSGGNCQAQSCAFQGVFLRAVDSIEGTIDGPGDLRDGVQIVKLVQ